YLFRPGQPFRPYLVGGVGGFSMGSRQDNLDFEVNGPGITLGTGFAYFVSERFALDFALRGDFINWEEATATLTLPGGAQTEVATPIEEEGSAAKVFFGLNWWFGKGS
ncbi:MAG: hypothetical protein HKN12_12100, partial [Gemmatimonadetes bacterium]|nr:hypothetical protein [Gemmatimonadota bacterium]